MSVRANIFKVNPSTATPGYATRREAKHSTAQLFRGNPAVEK